MSVIPDTKDITIYQGANWDWSLTFPPSVTLAGTTARMQVRQSVGASAVIIELTTENGRIAIDPAQSLMSLSLKPDETAALKFGNAVYDIELVFAPNHVWRILMGKVTLSLEVTR